MYFLQLQGGYAPLTPLYGRLISSLPDFFSSPVPEREREGGGKTSDVSKREADRDRYQERKIERTMKKE